MYNFHSALSNICTGKSATPAPMTSSTRSALTHPPVKEASTVDSQDSAKAAEEEEAETEEVEDEEDEDEEEEEEEEDAISKYECMHKDIQKEQWVCFSILLELKLLT